MPFEQDWRARRVVHKTPGGKMTRVKISSLPAEEQQKFNPNRFAKMSSMGATSKEQEEMQDTGNSGPPGLFKFFIGMDDVDDIDNIKEGELTLATNSGNDVITLFDDDLSVVNLNKVPLEAIVSGVYPKELKDGVDYSDIQVDSFADMDDDKKMEKVKFGGYTMFQLDLSPYLDVIEVSTDADNMESGGDVTEGFLKYYNYNEGGY